MTTSPLIVLERAVDVHRRLDRAGVPHAIGGALALAYHVAQARATNDIDLNVSADPKHPETVFALLPSDVPWTDRDVATVRRDGQVRLLWPLPDGGPPIPLDLFFPQHALHAAVDARAELVPMLDASVPILSATDLLVFKALFNRRKDWADIEELVKFGKPDLAEARRWLVTIVGAKDARLATLAEIETELART
jgi:hypothetical protein